MPNHLTLRRLLGKSLVFIGHLALIALVFVVPTAYVALDADPIGTLGWAVLALLVGFAVIRGGDWIADARRNRSLNSPVQATLPLR
jgi:hypothetical protein